MTSVIVLVDVQEKAKLELELNVHKSNSAALKSETERLTLELGELRGQLRTARETSDASKAQLSEVLKTANLNQSSEDPVGQLNDQLKSLNQQVSVRDCSHTGDWLYYTTVFLWL